MPLSRIVTQRNQLSLRLQAIQQDLCTWYQPGQPWAVYHRSRGLCWQNRIQAMAANRVFDRLAQCVNINQRNGSQSQNKQETELNDTLARAPLLSQQASSSHVSSGECMKQ